MITDFVLLDRVLEKLADATPTAVLHEEPAVAAHAVRSDVDVCLAADPLEVMRVIVPDMEREGIRLLLIFHYDRGAYSFFFSNDSASGGAQLDVLHDRQGRGRYGLRTAATLARARGGVRWPCPDPLDEALYVLRKRQVKGDRERMREARNRVLEFGQRRALGRVPELFGSRAAAAVAEAVAGEMRSRASTVELWKSRALRPSRLVRRCGFWADVAGPGAPNAAEKLAARMRRIVFTGSPAPSAVPRLMAELWRPRLLITATSSFAAWPRPDARLKVANGTFDLDQLARRLAYSMHSRLVGTYGLDLPERRP